MDVTALLPLLSAHPAVLDILISRVRRQGEGGADGQEDAALVHVAPERGYRHSVVRFASEHQGLGSGLGSGDWGDGKAGGSIGVTPQGLTVVQLTATSCWQRTDSSAGTATPRALVSNGSINAASIDCKQHESGGSSGSADCSEVHIVPLLQLPPQAFTHSDP